ncbi:MAG: hypothetical protein M3N47_09370 [Chloroflexota bacterium]|nr:hypothetical protein [Chloroflexota bacterium]
MAATPGERTRNERTLAEARARLGEPTVAEHQATGLSLSIEQAAAEALTLLQEVGAAPRTG